MATGGAQLRSVGEADPSQSGGGSTGGGHFLIGSFGGP